MTLKASLNCERLCPKFYRRAQTTMQFSDYTNRAQMPSAPSRLVSAVISDEESYARITPYRSDQRARAKIAQV